MNSRKLKYVDVIRITRVIRRASRPIVKSTRQTKTGLPGERGECACARPRPRPTTRPMRPNVPEAYTTTDNSAAKRIVPK